jgi:tetratricopeptide (TPR) repeat protein/tRNA A-37 threonylcarbamoyl transferase component Bud32
MPADLSAQIPQLPEPFASALRDRKWATIADAPADSPAALYARGQARLSLGRDADARDDFQAAASDLCDWCCIELAYLDLRQRRDVREALVIAMNVIKNSPPDSPLLARALHVAGLAEGKLRRSGPAIDLLLKSAKTYLKLRDFAARAQVYDTLGSVEAARGRLDFAVHFFALSLVDKTLLLDKAGIAITLGNIGRTHLRLGRFEDALECFGRDLYLAIEIGDGRGETRMHEDIGRTYLAMGETESADKSLQKCVELAGQRSYADLAFFAYKDLALLRISQNKCDEAEQFLDRARKVLSAGAEPYLHQVLSAAQGELALARDKPEAAKLLEEAVNAFMTAELPDLEIPTRILLARALLKQKLKATAEDCLLKGMQRARADGYGRYLPTLKQEMTRLELSEGIIEEKPRAIAESPNAGPATPQSPGDDYVILQRLGGGGFGEVFRAYDPLRARDVAIKRFRLAKLYDIRRRKALIASAKLELEAAARVRHPGVVRVSAVSFDDQGELYLVSDFVEGQSLRNVMNQSPRPAPGTVTRNVELIASALQALHEAGVIHRDLKPENVIITNDSLPVLVDFGIAHVSRSQATPIAAAGTPAYMSPEQSRGAAVDARADLYALGVIAYEWLTGNLPISPKGTDLKKIAFELAATQPTPLKKQRADLETDLCDLVMSLLEKDPDDRPQTASQVVDACRKFATRPAPVSALAPTEPDLPRG